MHHLRAQSHARARAVLIGTTTLLMIIAMIPPAASATTDALSIPVDFAIHDCRATVLTLEDEGGCAATLTGTIEALCDVQGCDVTVAITGGGLRGSGTPQPLFVSTNVGYQYYADTIPDPYGLSESTRGTLCTDVAMAASVTCTGTLQANLKYAEDITTIAPESDGCVLVALEVRSASSLLTAGGTGAYTHHARPATIAPGDTRPWSPAWYICHGEQGTFAIDETWAHN